MPFDLPPAMLNRDKLPCPAPPEVLNGPRLTGGGYSFSLTLPDEVRGPFLNGLGLLFLAGS